MGLSENSQDPVIYHHVPYSDAILDGFFSNFQTQKHGFSKVSQRFSTESPRFPPRKTAQPSDVPETPCHAAFGRAPKCPRPQKQWEIVKTSWDFYG